MKKLALTGLTLFSLTALAACSADTAKETASKSSETVASSSAEKETKSEKTNYDAIVSEIKTTLDPDNTGEIIVEVKNDVVDADFPEPHDVIEVSATGESKLTLEEIMDAYYSNTLTPEQDTALMLLRGTISSIAKKLPKDTTTISFGYEIGYHERQLVALSSKEKDLIPIE